MRVCSDNYLNLFTSSCISCIWPLCYCSLFVMNLKVDDRGCLVFKQTKPKADNLREKMWFCFWWLHRQYVWSLLSCSILWRPELREPLNKDIMLLQNSLFHLFSLSVKLAVQWQMVVRCRSYCCIVQLWLAGWAMGRWGLCGHGVHTPKKTQSLLQKLSKSQ